MVVVRIACWQTGIALCVVLEQTHTRHVIVNPVLIGILNAFENHVTTTGSQRYCQQHPASWKECSQPAFPYIQSAVLQLKQAHVTPCLLLAPSRPIHMYNILECIEGVRACGRSRKTMVAQTNNLIQRTVNVNQRPALNLMLQFHVLLAMAVRHKFKHTSI